VTNFLAQTTSDLHSPIAHGWSEFIQIETLRATTITILSDIFVPDLKPKPLHEALT